MAVYDNIPCDELDAPADDELEYNDAPDVPDDKLEYDDAPDYKAVYDDIPDFSVSEFENEHFKLDYSTILKDYNKSDKDDQTASANTSRSAESTDKRQTLSTSFTKNKRQRYLGNVTKLLEVLESKNDDEDDGEGWRSQQALTSHNVKKGNYFLNYCLLQILTSNNLYHYKINF